MTQSNRQMRRDHYENFLLRAVAKFNIEFDQKRKDLISDFEQEKKELILGQEKSFVKHRNFFRSIIAAASILLGFFSFFVYQDFSEFIEAARIKAESAIKSQQDDLVKAIQDKGNEVLKEMKC